MFVITNCKGRVRPNVSKKYQIFMNKLTTSDHKIEGKLRILRSYRVKLLHQYCREVLRDAYQETIAMQLLKVCDELRLKANLLPGDKKGELLICCGVSEFLENLPREMVKHSCFANDPVFNIDNYQTGVFDTLFYVPSSSEVCNLDNKIAPELKSEASFASGIAEQIDENDLEATIRTVMAKKPTMVKRFKGFKNVSEYVRNGIVVSNFQEAYTYSSHTFNMLVYLSLVNNIFDLEFTIQKLNSSGRDIFALERSVYSGQLFWKDESTLDQDELDKDDESQTEKEIIVKPQTISTKIIKRIVQARRERRHLYDDLQGIKENLQNIKKFIKNKDECSIEKVINILINHHYYYFYLTLHGMEKLQEIY